MSSENKVVQRDAKDLAAGYSGGFRVVEILAILSFIVLSGVIFFRLSPYFLDHTFLLISSVVLGWIAADFVSGLVHWAGDTWGTPEWPVLGPAFIRTFREHHVDPLSITRHDFIEVNGSNCLVSIPVLMAAYYLQLNSIGSIKIMSVSFLLSLCLWVFLTNQTHKWAHQGVNSRIVKILQNSGLLLSPEMHQIHHVAPYITHYCITSGVLNRPLAAIGFYRNFEKLISTITGAVPRKDDIGLI